VLDVIPRRVKNFWLDADTRQLSNETNSPPHAAVDMAEFSSQANSAEFGLRTIRIMTKNIYYGCCPEPYPVIEVELGLQRGMLTIFFGMMVPLIVVTIVGFCTMCMPAPISGARPGLSVTVMLTTATVYLVASRLTPQSNTTTILTRLYIVCFLLSGILVIIAIINTALNSIQASDSISEDVLMKWFQHFDGDHSGYLDRSEAAAALQALGLSKKEQQRVFKTFDSDDDGQISMEEWRAIADMTKKSDGLSTYHNYLTWFMVTSKLWSAEYQKRNADKVALELSWFARTVKMGSLWFAGKVKKSAVGAVHAAENAVEEGISSHPHSRHPPWTSLPALPFLFFVGIS